MADFGGIKLITLDEPTKLKHEKFMADAFVILSKAASERKAFGSVKLLRDGFKRGDCNLIHSPRARGVMQDMIALEETILGGYIKMLHKMIVSFDIFGQVQRPGVEYVDYAQEAAWGIYDAQYTFTGAERFSTYAFVCAKRRILTFVRYEERTTGISQAVNNLRIKVRHLMSTYHLDFEDAVGRLQAEDDSVTAEVISKVKSALCQMKSTEEQEFEQEPEAHVNEQREADDQADMREDTSAMREAISLADLTPLERALLEAYVQGDRRFRTELLERATKVAARMLRDEMIAVRGNRSFRDTITQMQLDRDVEFPVEVIELAVKGGGPGPMLNDPLAVEIVNRDTFKPISKQRISQYYKRACAKACEVYEQGKPEVKEEAAA